MPPKAAQSSHTNGGRKESEGKTEEWKHRAPYHIHRPSEDFSAVWEGGCHCGKVQYQLSREKPLAAKYCHCTTCQRLHGAPFQWAAIFHKDDINFTEGHHSLTWYDSRDKTLTHDLPCKVSCSHCRSSIMDEGRNMILLFPTLIKEIGTEKGRECFKPTCHMFYPQRVVDIRDGLAKYSGLDGNSDLLDEDGEVIKGEEEVKKEKAKAKEEGEKKRKRQSGGGGGK